MKVKNVIICVACGLGLLSLPILLRDNATATQHTTPMVIPADSWSFTIDPPATLSAGCSGSTTGVLSGLVPPTVSTSDDYVPGDFGDDPTVVTDVWASLHGSTELSPGERIVIEFRKSSANVAFARLTLTSSQPCASMNSTTGWSEAVVVADEDHLTVAIRSTLFCDREVVYGAMGFDTP